MIAEFCTTFQERALWTNTLIARGQITRLGILEETITNMHLVEIQARHPEHVYTKVFGKREEGTASGAD